MKTILKIINRIWLVMMTLLGFTYCDRNVKEMYGMPTADFITNGKVKNTITNIGIEGIQVKMQYDSVKTDSGGKFRIDLSYYYNHKDTTFIYCRDVDGTENGSYQDKDTFVITTGEIPKGGKVEKNIEIPLKPKE